MSEDIISKIDKYLKMLDAAKSSEEKAKVLREMYTYLRGGY